MDLPQAIERYIAAQSKIYAQEGERLLQEVLVNAQIRVEERRTFDKWNGGTYGHALFLYLPESIFLKIAKDRQSIQRQLQTDLNQLHSFQNEHVSDVFLEMRLVEDVDWRGESGLLVGSTRQVMDASVRRIWADGCYRLFLSHKTEFKRETAQLKDSLSRFGVSCFVAHEDIHPTMEWQDEIENALATTDAFVALMTEKFHESNWTDHEIGYALDRGVPMIAIRLGRDPYGFLGKFQGLTATWQNAPTEIAKVLIKQDRMLASFIDALPKCSSFDVGNALSSVLPSIKEVSNEQAAAFVKAYNNSPELRGSFGFNGNRPQNHGQGLVHHLHRWGYDFWEKRDNGTLDTSF